MLTCTVVSPEENKKYTDLASVFLPTASGQAQIMPNHAEAFFLLKKGSIGFQRSAGDDFSIKTNGGQCFVKDDVVTIIL